MRKGTPRIQESRPPFLCLTAAGAAGLISLVFVPPASDSAGAVRQGQVQVPVREQSPGTSAFFLHSVPFLSAGFCFQGPHRLLSSRALSLGCWSLLRLHAQGADRKGLGLTALGNLHGWSGGVTAPATLPRSGSRWDGAPTPERPGS